MVILFQTNGLRRASFHTFSAFSAFLWVNSSYFFFIQSNSLFRAFLNACSAAHAFFSINFCRHDYLLRFATRAGCWLEEAIYTFCDFLPGLKTRVCMLSCSLIMFVKLKSPITLLVETFIDFANRSKGKMRRGYGYTTYEKPKRD